MGRPDRQMSAGNPAGKRLPCGVQTAATVFGEPRHLQNEPTGAKSTHPTSPLRVSLGQKKSTLAGCAPLVRKLTLNEFQRWVLHLPPRLCSAMSRMMPVRIAPRCSSRGGQGHVELVHPASYLFSALSQLESQSHGAGQEVLLQRPCLPLRLSLRSIAMLLPV